MRTQQGDDGAKQTSFLDRANAGTGIGPPGRLDHGGADVTARSKVPRLLGWMLLIFAMRGAAAAITVGAGSSLNFADGTLDLGCSDLNIAGSVAANTADFVSIAHLDLAGGSFAPGASRVSLGGDFTNSGSFAPGSSRVAIVDACGNGTSRISGTTDFYDFVVSSTAGKQILFPVAAVQSVGHSLTLQGAAGRLLQVGSTAAGQQGVLALANGAAQTIAYVSARDNRASIAHIAPGPPVQFDSIDGGNLVNWFLDPSAAGALVAAPTLGVGGWMLLAALLLGATRNLLRRNRKFSR